MAGVQPVAVYALRIPPGDILVPAVPEFAAMFRVTMAAIDPSAEPELEDADDKKPPRATLKVVRVADDLLEDSEDDDDYEDVDDDDEEDSDDEEVNGGPSEKKSSKQKKIVAQLKAALKDEDDDDMDEDESSDDDGDDAAAIAALQKAMASSKKGKAKALDDDEDDSEDDDDESLELDEVVLCTLDPEKNYQQPLDFTVAEGEKIFFKVSGTHTIHLTGNYVMPLDDISDDDEEDDEGLYDLSPDEEELDILEGLGDEESDELDDIEDPRLMEVDSDEEVQIKALPAPSKGKNKRSAESDEEEPALDDIMAKALKKEGAAAAEEETKKLSKAEKKKLKKLKNNEGQAASAPETTKATETKKETPQVNGTAPESDKKKVQFAKNLEQGPTPSTGNKANDNKKMSPSLGVRTVDGVVIDDRKAGSGPQAKKGSRLDLRYIGKLESGKQFDANKSGKPFSVKLGANEVIKGWEIGLQGITAGGERRITIPAGLAYGNKALPGIPKNSKLIFDIKCLAVK